MSDRSRPDPARLVLGGAASALVALLGSVVLGEYEFEGVFPIVAGPLYGYLLAEIAVSLSKHPGWLTGGWSVVLAAGGLFWAGRIDSNFGVEPLADLVWVAVALGGVTALVRGVGWSVLRGAVRSSRRGG